LKRIHDLFKKRKRGTDLATEKGKGIVCGTKRPERTYVAGSRGLVRTASLLRKEGKGPLRRVDLDSEASFEEWGNKRGTALTYKKLNFSIDYVGGREGVPMEKTHKKDYLVQKLASKHGDEFKGGKGEGREKKEVTNTGGSGSISFGQYRKSFPLEYLVEASGRQKGTKKERGCAKKRGAMLPHPLKNTVGWS